MSERYTLMESNAKYWEEEYHRQHAARRGLERENERLRRIEEAANDPFLVLLERTQNADPHVNAEMRRAADRLREALADAGGEA